MKAVRIILIVIIAAAAVAVIGGAVYVRFIAARGLPDYNAGVEMDGIKGEVTVYRDAYGVPHIFAENEGDLYRAVGWCMAQDRLWQMDLLRRVCTGRLSEVLGEDLVETDLFMRALRMPEKTRMALERTDERVIDAVEAFVDGVNQYIDARNDSLPPEFSILGYKPEKFEVEHIGNLVGYMTWDLTMGWDAELFIHKIGEKLGKEMMKDLLTDVASHRTVVYPDFKLKLSMMDTRYTLLEGGRRLKDLGLVVFSGSNNWAVSGKKSVTRKPILANDMHLDLNTPGIWYQIHQVLEGKMNVTGVAVPGQPFVVAGHNDHIAWGFTNVMVDNLDFYLEKINPDNPNQYEFNGAWRDMEVRREKIKVKGGEVVERELRFTHRGPVVSGFKDVPDLAISIRWIGNEYSNEASTLYKLNRAADWNAFRSAMKDFRATSQNTVYADVMGNIGLQCSAGVPIRKGAADMMILPGWTDEYDWTGLVPFEELPYSFNPEKGSVSSANNRTVGDDYPHYISNWYCLHYRIDRIREMLTEKEKLSVEDFKLMHADQKAKLAEDIKDVIVSEAEKADDLSGMEKQALEMLRSWDGVLDRSSPAASLFEQFLVEFKRNTFEDEMGEDLYREFLGSSLLPRYAVDNIFRKGGSPWCDDVTTGAVKETLTDMVQKSFRDSAARLSSVLGGDPSAWQWGSIHKLTLEHPLGSVKMLDRLFRFNRGPWEVGGSFHTVCPYGYPFKDPFRVNHGASQRHIYNLADWDSSITVIPTGVSGIPASDHYCDQTELYVNNRYHSDYISRNLIEKNAKYEMRIKGKD